VAPPPPGSRHDRPSVLLQILHGKRPVATCPIWRATLHRLGLLSGAHPVALGVWQQLLRRTTAPWTRRPQTAGMAGHRTFSGGRVELLDVGYPRIQSTLAQPAGSDRAVGSRWPISLALFHARTGFLMEIVADPWHTHDMARVTAMPSDVTAGRCARGGSRVLLLCPLALLRQQQLLPVSAYTRNKLSISRPLVPTPRPNPRPCRRGGHLPVARSWA